MGRARVPRGEKLAKVSTRKVTATLPEAEFEDLVNVVEGTRMWTDLADFTRQAVREKLAKYHRENPLGVPKRRD